MTENYKYADCTIEWADTHETADVVFKLSCDCEEDSKEDDAIFFYCNGIEELEQMKEFGPGTDFRVVSINELLNNLTA